MKLQYVKEISVKKEVDVFIAGGGPAGITAAVAAARHGMSVFLVEMFGSFGGSAAHALVPAFMQFTDGINFLAGGIGKEIRDAVKSECPLDARQYCPDNIPVEVLKLCCDNLAVKAGVDFRFFTSVIDVEHNNGVITHAICTGKGETYAVKATIFIDCTGDGDLCAQAGASFYKGDENADGEMMAATLCGLWAGIDWSNVKRPDSRRLDDAFADQVFSNEDRHLPGMWPINKGVGGSNAGHVYDVDGTRADSLTRAMVSGRKQLQEYRRYYRNYLSGFENAELVISGTQIGVRETRRIVGDYQLNLNDFLSRAVFEDEIGRYAYPIDIHAGKNTQASYDAYEKTFADLRYKPGDSYGIPYRSLLVQGFDNLLTAGRCISTDRSMQASVRVMPGCFITGQAAGTAAAVAVNDGKDVRSFPVSKLQEALLKLGAYLPNYLHK